MVRVVSIGIIALLVGAGRLFFFPLHLERPPLAAPSEVNKETEPARLLFVGDMFFDRSIRTTAEQKGYDYLLSCVKDRLLSYDAVVGNLEGPVTDKKSVSVGSFLGSWQNFTFTFAPDVAPLLLRHNIRIVDLGNNHIDNMQEEGVLQTRSYLDKADVGHFGGPVYSRGAGATSSESIYRTTVQEQKFSFISYNQFGDLSPEDTVPLIAAEKKDGRFVVVFSHWGEEYVPPVAAVKRAARLFSNAGADLIIGAHPHVVQGHEQVGDTLVYYSLGNFLFDQFFSEEVSHGLAVDVTVNHGKLVSTVEYKTTMGKDRRVCFSGDE